MYFCVLFVINPSVIIFQQFLEDFLFDTEVKVRKDKGWDDDLYLDEIYKSTEPQTESLQRPKAK